MRFNINRKTIIDNKYLNIFDLRILSLKIEIMIGTKASPTKLERKLGLPKVENICKFGVFHLNGSIPLT
jgi:hypothetical protein